MSQITYIAYAAAALRFLQAGHRLILVLLSVMLLVWFVVLASIRERVATDEPWSKVDGWSRPISSRSAETLVLLQGVSASTAMMSLGLTLFGPLLVIWAFLP